MQKSVDLALLDDVADTGWKEDIQIEDENGRTISLIYEDTPTLRGRPCSLSWSTMPSQGDNLSRQMTGTGTAWTPGNPSTAITSYGGGWVGRRGTERRGALRMDLVPDKGEQLRSLTVRYCARLARFPEPIGNLPAHLATILAR